MVDADKLIGGTACLPFFLWSHVVDFTDRPDKRRRDGCGCGCGDSGGAHNARDLVVVLHCFGGVFVHNVVVVMVLRSYVVWWCCLFFCFSLFCLGCLFCCFFSF